jgi:hypothetical protein
LTEETLMDDMRLLTELRREVPPITPDARLAARTRLMTAAAATAPARARIAPAPRLRPRRRLAWRLATAAALSVVIAGGLTLSQVVNVGEPGGGVAVLPAPAIANAAELGNLAAKAVQNDPVPGPDQWNYVKIRFVPAGATEEHWYRVDGKKVAIDYGEGGLHVADGGKFGWYGPGIPDDPDQALAFFRAEVTKRAGGETRRWRAVQEAVEGKAARQGSLTVRKLDDAVFNAINDTLRIEPLEPKVRATLYHTLALLPGITVRPDVTDALGRPGVAFALPGGPTRQEIVLDAKTFRYLGSQLVAVQDLPATPVELPPGKSDKDGKGATGFAGAKAGSVIDALAIVETSLVDEAGARG